MQYTFPIINHIFLFQADVAHRLSRSSFTLEASANKDPLSQKNKLYQNVLNRQTYMETKRKKKQRMKKTGIYIHTHEKKRKAKKKQEMNKTRRNR